MRCVPVLSRADYKNRSITQFQCYQQQDQEKMELEQKVFKLENKIQLLLNDNQKLNTSLMIRLNDIEFLKQNCSEKCQENCRNYRIKLDKLEKDKNDADMQIETLEQSLSSLAQDKQTLELENQNLSSNLSDLQEQIRLIKEEQDNTCNIWKEEIQQFREKLNEAQEQHKQEIENIKVNYQAELSSLQTQMREGYQASASQPAQTNRN